MQPTLLDAVALPPEPPTEIRLFKDGWNYTVDGHTNPLEFDQQRPQLVNRASVLASRKPAHPRTRHAHVTVVPLRVAVCGGASLYLRFAVRVGESSLWLKRQRDAFGEVSGCSG